MTVERFAVSIETELALAVRQAADADEQNVSAWLADAARRQLATRGLRGVVAAWERDHGAFSDDELAAARALAADDSAQVSVHAGVVAQAWRDGSRPALLARALTHCDEVPLEGPLARATGLLCGSAGNADIVDASVALIAAARSRTGRVRPVSGQDAADATRPWALRVGSG